VSSIFEERDKECLYFKLPYRKKYLVELTGILIENKFQVPKFLLNLLDF